MIGGAETVKYFTADSLAMKGREVGGGLVKEIGGKKIGKNSSNFEAPTNHQKLILFRQSV